MSIDVVLFGSIVNFIVIVEGAGVEGANELAAGAIGAVFFSSHPTDPTPAATARAATMISRFMTPDLLADDIPLGVRGYNTQTLRQRFRFVVVFVVCW
jgi:hypothetical protein